MSTTSGSGPELFIGMVGAVGTDLEFVVRLLTESLVAVRYSTKRTKDGETSIRLAKLLRKIGKYKDLRTTPVDVYTEEHMTAGDDFRKVTGRDDALALLAVTEIMEERKDGDERGLVVGNVIPRRAYILRSLKNPRELQTLREVYGEAFHLVAAYSPHEARRDYLAKRIAESRSEFPADRHFDKAEALILRDQEELGLPHGQNVRGIFHRADVFVDTTDPNSLRRSVNRLIELLFGNTFHTPTRQEYAMFHAQASALRSAEPGRQVGAAIATEEGDIISVGANEVPKAGGGLYWCGDVPDGREFSVAESSSELYVESNQRHIRNLVTDTLRHLKNASWLTSEKSELEINALVDMALRKKDPALPPAAQIRNLIEFGRAVHAEMAALIDAARRGVSVRNCTMYVTTFPCHLCARHIVAAGIRRVVYIEPYAKSLAADLYPDSIAIEGGSNDKVTFEPFVGVSPRQYVKLFSMGKRKTDEGHIGIFDPTVASLRYHGIPRVYLDNEEEQAAILNNVMIAKGLTGGTSNEPTTSRDT
ncbi:MAG TPA: anti-phage dCTP deaminase [Candidatus Acidoferrum sp.]|nr:anti-phage dCTP deaminase [Candidatus Acidoferrum sp.]